MISPIHTIISSAREESYIQYPLPDALFRISTAFKDLHLFWKAFQDYQMVQKNVQNRDAEKALTKGAILHFLSRQSDTIGYVVKIVLIAQCSEELFRRLRKAYLAYQQMIDAVKGKYPFYQKIDWNIVYRHPLTRFSPTLALNYFKYKQRYSLRLTRLMEALKLLCIQLFKLSMSMRDASLIIEGDSIASFRACTVLNYKWHKYEKRLSEDYLFLFEELEKQAKTIDRILAQIQSDQNASSLIAKTRAFLESSGYRFLEGGKMIASTSKEILEPLGPLDKLVPFEFRAKEVWRKQFPETGVPPWTGEENN